MRVEFSASILFKNLSFTTMKKERISYADQWCGQIYIDEYINKSPSELEEAQTK